MVNTFSLLLVISTIITGLLWFINKFFFIIRRDSYKKNVLYNFNKQLDGKICNIPKMKSSGLETIASIFPILAVVLIIRSFVYEPFQIPSGSMMPTLLIGDFILVEKFSYGIKDPIYQKTLIKTGHPKRGDIVVFKYPDNPNLNYIKRIIGLPGDKITYDSIRKEISIQSNYKSAITCKNTIPVTYSNVRSSNFIQTFLYQNNGKISSDFFEISQDKNIFKQNGIRLMERKETLNGKTYRILTTPIIQDQLEAYYRQTGQNLATWIVPFGKYFVMGDNRDNSADSRYWGFVPEENLVSKATIIWMSLKKQEGKWPTGIRLDRIGRIY